MAGLVGWVSGLLGYEDETEKAEREAEEKRQSEPRLDTAATHTGSAIAQRQTHPHNNN